MVWQLWLVEWWMMKMWSSEMRCEHSLPDHDNSIITRLCWPAVKTWNASLLALKHTHTNTGCHGRTTTDGDSTTTDGQQSYSLIDWLTLTDLKFNVSLETKYVILEMFCRANLLASTEIRQQTMKWCTSCWHKQAKRYVPSLPGRRQSERDISMMQPPREWFWSGTVDGFVDVSTTCGGHTATVASRFDFQHWAY